MLLSLLLSLIACAPATGEVVNEFPVMHRADGACDAQLGAAVDVGDSTLYTVEVCSGDWVTCTPADYERIDTIISVHCDGTNAWRVTWLE